MIGKRPEAARLYVMERGDLRLTLTDIGASVQGLVFRGTDVVLGLEGPESYRENGSCLGTTVGRSANRIAGGCFALNGKDYPLAKNDGENNLHSGPNGWHTRQWETGEAGEDRVIFRLESPDGDQGFPGSLEASVTYTLSADAVMIEYKALSDADTVFNPTNHAYFNLNGHDSGDVLGHSLRLFADAYTPVGPGLIPTGEIVSVEGTPFDFRTPHSIGRDIGADHPQLRTAGGYDHNFCLNGSGLRPAAELAGDKTGITMTLLTDRPGVQLYTANFLSGERGKGGAVYGRWGGVCLETQCWPDAIHKPGFPSPVLRAGEVFHSLTVWRFRGAEHGDSDGEKTQA